jgi:glutamyl-tRNA synthetase
VAKAPDNPAYQLAVVADDIAMGVTEVVRGDDLIPSTARQILIYRALAAVTDQIAELRSPAAALDLPRYGHAPLVVGPDGKRLAKRHGDARIASFRESGVSAARIAGTLARWSGLESPPDVTPRELLNQWSWSKLKRERVVLTAEMLRSMGVPPMS